MRRTRNEELNPEQLLRRKKIFIPVRDLNPILKQGIFMLNIVRGGKIIYTGAIAFNNPMRLSSLFMFHVGTKIIQEHHRDFIDAMYKYGVLNTANEGNYPSDWMNPATIMRTHPIFFLTPRGITFVRESKAEHMRYRVQKNIIGKAGLHPWFWRAYLRPPEAPAAWKKKANKSVEDRATTVKGFVPQPAKRVPHTPFQRKLRRPAHGR